jgi:hypothetical protein
VRRALRDVRRQLEQEPDAVIPDDLLVNEVLWLGNPEAVAGRDAVIPGGNVGLAKTWLRARLAGEANTEDDRRELALRMAALPDEEPGRRGWGLDRRRLERAIVYEAERRRWLN